jgi:predicted dehydrogenase
MAEPGGQPGPGEGKVLRVGVLGLGRRWRRHYRPALRALRGCFEVVAVCDQVAARAGLTARRLHCAAAVGPTELLERPDVDALLLPDPQWYGLWPLEPACRLNKPVYCGFPPAHDEAHADRLRQAVEDCGLPVMVALAAPFSPALTRLRELLAAQLGAPRLLLGTLTARGASRPAEESALPPGLIPMLGWCALLLDGEPRRVLAAGTQARMRWAARPSP